MYVNFIFMPPPIIGTEALRLPVLSVVCPFSPFRATHTWWTDFNEARQKFSSRVLTSLKGFQGQRSKVKVTTGPVNL